MDEEIETLLVNVRADTRAFDRDIQVMRGQLDSGLGAGAERAGQRIETALLRAIRTGKFGFEDLKALALSILSDIASAVIKGGLGQIGVGGGGGGGSGGGLNGLLSLVLSMFGNRAGRAIGGPVSPGRPYMVGERGPELFVPTSSGNVVANGASGPRDVRISIAINAPASSAPKALGQSSRQVARAVRRALEGG